MADDDSNCMAIKRPSLFVIILDFIVFLVLVIGFLKIHYQTSDDSTESPPDG
jgi:hypothetical protein